MGGMYVYPDVHRGPGRYLDGAVQRSIACFARHSLTPNAELVWIPDILEYGLRAIITIRQGHEIRINHDTTEWEQAVNGYTHYTHLGF
jgi:hypothetical protein